MTYPEPERRVLAPPRARDLGRELATFCLALTLVLCACKFANIEYLTHWSWWAVTSPLWGLPVFVLALATLFLLVFVCACFAAWLWGVARED